MKIAIITSPRSGSTWLYRILVRYLRLCNPQALCLDEYFNVEQLQRCFVPVRGDKPGHEDTNFSVFSRNEIPENAFQLDYDFKKNLELVYRPFTLEKAVRLQKLLSAGDWQNYLIRESTKRLQWLTREKSEHVLLKVMGEDLSFNPEILEFLAKCYKIIFLKREDTEKQILSFCLSEATGVWTTSFSQPTEKLLCERQWITQIRRHLFLYEKARQIVSDAQEVSYEQLIKWGSPVRILEGLGLPFSGRDVIEGPSFHPKQKKDYLEYFSNPQQILSWSKFS